MGSVTEHWTRSGWADIQRKKDGLTVAAAILSPAIRTVALMMPPLSLSTFNAQWLKGTRAALESSPCFGLICVRELDDRREQLEAGRLGQRLHLEATRLGIAAQPLNQWMERVDRERETRGLSPSAAGIRALTGDDSWRPTFAFRMGFPTQTALPPPSSDAGHRLNRGW
jgi:hypothetical protein